MLPMTTATTNPYRLLYDGQCPVCRREVQWLLRRRPHAFAPVDIAAPDFDAAILSTLGLRQQDLNAQLYGIRPDGSLTVGMATIRAAYRCAGLGWAIGWTALWPARPVCDALYRRFARNRLRIGRLLGRRDDDADNCGERCRL